MAKRAKVPRHLKTPQDDKIPRGGGRVLSGDAELIAWHIRTIDREGEWGWDGLDAETVWEQVWATLKDLETMTWSAIMTNGSHPIGVDALCSKAQKRLEQIGQDDVDELFSLRIAGRPRLWGIRDGRVLKILWWDPKHAVCPSHKKGT